MIIIIASLNSTLLLLVSRPISLGATLSVSSQQHPEYILVLKRTTAFSHLVSTKPATRFYGLREKKYILKGQNFWQYCTFLK